jgi:hypothetical protein
MFFNDDLKLRPFKDLGRDNTGSLVKFQNLDKGLLIASPQGAYRILITMRYGICVCERLAE